MKRAISFITVTAMVGTLLTGFTSAKSVNQSKMVPAAAHTNCTINYFTWAQSPNDAYPQNMIDAFQKKYPWIKVNFEMGPSQEADYEQQQKVKFLANDGIDVTTIYPSIYKNYINAGYLVNLTGANYLKNYSASTLSQATVNKKVYGIPYAKDVVGVMYNKNLFKKHGWKVPTNQADWLKLCNKIAAAGITPMINGAKDAWPLAHEVMPFMQDLYVNNPSIFTKISAGKAKYTDKVFVNCFTKIQKYFKSKAVSKAAMGLTYDQSCAYFAAGKAAMMCHGEWAMASIASAKPKFSVGVFQVPYNKKGQKQVGAAEVGQIQVIASCSKNKDAAKDFIAYMSSKTGASYFAKSMGNFTTVKGVVTTGKEQWSSLLDAKAVPFYYDQMYSGASAELFKQLQLLYIGNTSVKSALNSIQLAQKKSK